MLETIKQLLGISGTGSDSLLNAIIALTQSRLKVLLGGANAVPESLVYIVTEVSIRRFNRIGSEGLQSHSVEGETMTWPDDDFAPFDDDIQAYLDAQKDAGTSRGRVRFL